jgi:hypothetical protein
MKKQHWREFEAQALRVSQLVSAQVSRSATGILPTEAEERKKAGN